MNRAVSVFFNYSVNITDKMINRVLMLTNYNIHR